MWTLQGKDSRFAAGERGATPLVAPAQIDTIRMLTPIKPAIFLQPAGTPMLNQKPALADLLRGALVLLASICCCTVRASASEDVIWPMPDWQMSTPEEQGMDSAELAKLLAFGRTRSFDSLLIARHGRIVLDAYYTPYTADIPHVLNSSTKGVVSSLIAMVRKDGLLDSFDHPVLDLFADQNAANVDDKKKAMTVQHLLDMTSGFDWDEGYQGGKEQSLVELRRSADWVKFILDRPMAHAPGEILYYNSGNSHLLSALVTRLTGQAPSPTPMKSCSVRSGSRRHSGPGIRKALRPVDGA
ncbi:MAG TPA: serine hydrolase domain-containing protein [Sphingomicrobium sp.]|jgi:CubicO group peptidase (beta-lactamase class C family)